jgi:hypothetical protein
MIVDMAAREHAALIVMGNTAEAAWTASCSARSPNASFGWHRAPC